MRVNQIALLVANLSILARAQRKSFPLTTSLSVKDTVDSFQSRHEDRDLRHTVPPVITPRGCTYEFDHGTTTFVDEIFCPDWCGDGQDFTFTTTTLCDASGDCESFADCRVIGCTDDCGPGVNDCPCDTALASFEAVCDDVCLPGTEAPVAYPTQAPVPPPTDAPVAMPVPMPVTPAPVAPEPTPVTPAPVAPEPTPVTPAPVAPEPTPSIECFSDTTALLQEVTQADTSEVTTYTLCPNTVFDIGRLDGLDGTVVGGMAPLVARSNTHYVCGENGSVADNCVFRGGQVQVFSSFSFFSESTTDCLIKGMTFEDANGAGASLGNVGDITFEDCIFRVSDSFTVTFCAVVFAKQLSHKRMPSLCKRIMQMSVLCFLHSIQTILVPALAVVSWQWTAQLPPRAWAVLLRS